MSDECEHGSQRRKCELCERDNEIVKLRALCAEASGTMRLCACCQKNEIVDKLRSAWRGEGTE